MANPKASGDTQEVSERRVLSRQRQIEIGKVRPEYRKYVQEVQHVDRQEAQPHTPDPRANVSKRQFDRQLSTWRRLLHEFDDDQHQGDASDAFGPGSAADGEQEVYDDGAFGQGEHHPVVRQLPYAHGEAGGPVPLRLDTLLDKVAGDRHPSAPFATPEGRQPFAQLQPSSVQHQQRPGVASPPPGAAPLAKRLFHVAAGSARPGGGCGHLSPAPDMSATPAPRQHQLRHVGGPSPMSSAPENMTPESIARPSQEFRALRGNRSVKTNMKKMVSSEMARCDSPHTPRKPDQGAQAAVNSHSRANSPPSSGTLPRTPLNMTGRTPSPKHMSETVAPPEYTRYPQYTLGPEQLHRAVLQPMQQFVQTQPPPVSWAGAAGVGALWDC